MPKKIDWMYDRRSCETCKKTRAFLQLVEGKVNETQDASKVKYGPTEALTLLPGIDTLVVMKGKKVVTFDLAGDRPDDETLQAHIIGPTGNLRAPTAKIGKLMVVGFNEEIYKKVLNV